MTYFKKILFYLFVFFIVLLLITISVTCLFVWNKTVRDFLLEQQTALTGYQVEIEELRANSGLFSIKNFSVGVADHEIISGEELSLTPEYLTLFSSRPIVSSAILKKINANIELEEGEEGGKEVEEATEEGTKILFSLGSLSISDSKIKVNSADIFSSRIKIKSLAAKGINEGGIEDIEFVADIDHKILGKGKSEKKVKDSTREQKLSFLIKQLNIDESKFIYEDLSKNKITTKLTAVEGKSLSLAGISAIEILGDLEFLNLNEAEAKKIALVNNLQLRSGVKFENKKVILSALNLAFPTQQIFIDNKEHNEASLELLGDFIIGSTNTGIIENFSYNKGADNILEFSGTFSLADKIQDITLKLANLSSVFVEEFVELPGKVKQFSANGEYHVVLDKYQLQEVTGNGLFKNIHVESELKNYPDLNYILQITSDGIVYDFKETQIEFFNAEKLLGGLTILGRFDSSDSHFDITSDIVIDDLKKAMFFLTTKEIAQAKPLSASIKLNGTAEKLTLYLPQLKYADGSLEGNLVKDGNDFDILVSGKKLLARDLYELSIMDSSKDVTGMIDNIFGELKYSDKYPLGVSGNFKMKGTEFNFSNRLQDVFPFNLLFLPFSVLDKTLSAFPAQLIPSQLSEFSSATKGSIDNIQRLRATSITINGKSDGDWLTLDEASFNMSGVTPDIEMPGRISKDSLKINSGIFLVGNKVPLPIIGAPSFPLPDVVRFTKELAKTILNAPLETIKGIGNITGITSLFGSDELQEEVDIDAILEERKLLLEKINEEGAADFVKDAVQEETDSSDPVKISVEKTLEAEEKGKTKIKIETHEVPAIAKPETPVIIKW